MKRKFVEINDREVGDYSVMAKKLLVRFCQLISSTLNQKRELKILIATKGDIYYSPACTYYYTIDTPSITHNRDHAKKYRYAQNMLRLSHDLARAIHYDTRQLRQQDRHFLWLMLRRAILAGPSMKLLAETFRTLVQIVKGSL